MQILIWNSPWVSQGSLFFFNNTFKNHLILQANALYDEGCKVDIILTDQTVQFNKLLKDGINRIHISTEESINMVTPYYDVSEILYKNKFNLSNIKKILCKKLKKNYDAILLWENPVPFLYDMYNDSLIINQMPGFFSRPPYPSTVICDTHGLYKNGAIYNYFKKLARYKKSSSIIELYEFESKKYFNKNHIFESIFYNAQKNFSQFILLPLQVTYHYNFVSDTFYKSQVEFLIDVFERFKNTNNGIIVTQYNHRLIKDTILNEELLQFINNKYQNIIFSEDFNKIPTISQFLIPYVDSIASCSSSLVLHAALFNKNINIFGSSFLRFFDSEFIKKFNTDPYKNILSFIFERYEILMENILNGKFLINYINELKYRKKAYKDIDVYPHIIDIDNLYLDKINNIFNDNYKNTVQNVPCIDKKRNEFVTKVYNQKINVISFDLFDTLITRAIYKPSDIYIFIDLFVSKISCGAINGFGKIRERAEIESRKEKESNEILIEDIYKYIHKNFNIDKNILLKTLIFEKKLEYNISCRYNYGSNLFKIAKDTKKLIIVISDMYLDSKFLECLLNKNGYTDIAKLFVSCEFLASKKNGKLFEKVFNYFSINNFEKNQFIHIGDNKINDIENSQRFGFSAVKLLSPSQKVNKNKLYNDIFKKIPSNSIYGIILKGLITSYIFSDIEYDHEDSLFFEKIENIGFVGFGPVLVPYIIWIIRNIRNKNINNIYFLAREGKILKDIYDVFYKYFKDLPKSHYILASRRSLNIASLNSDDDIRQICFQPITLEISSKELAYIRFGIVINEDFIIDRTIESKIKFYNLMLKYKNKIFIEAKNERLLYFSYLKQNNIMNNDNIVIVDIGWKANMQLHLSRMLKKKITGMYYGCIPGSETTRLSNNLILSFSGDIALDDSTSILVNKRHFFELCCCSSAKSFMFFKKENGKRVPVFEDENENYYNSRRVFIEKLHNGILIFAKKLAEHFIDYFDYIYFDLRLNEIFIRNFLMNPLKKDIDLFNNIIFSDKVGSAYKNINNLI